MNKNSFGNKLLKHKVIIVAIVFIVLFIIFENIGISIDSHKKSYNTVENNKNNIELYQKQDKNNYKISSDLFFATANAFLGIGLLSFAWELIMQKSWLEIVRENILYSLSSPEVAEHINDEWKLKITDKLLNLVSGENTGKTLFNGIKNNTFSDSLLRKNFIYNITITNRDDHFYNASFYIQFDLSNIPQTISIRLAKQEKSQEIHNFYQSLVKNNDIYRYILYTNKKNIPSDCFKIEKCSISSNNNPNKRIDLSVNYPNPNKIFEESILLTPNSTDINTYKEICKSESCNFVFRINTIIDKSWSYFPIMFGYPVKRFSTRFDAKDCSVSEINIMEFFTSSDIFVRDESIHESIIAAAGSINDIILPDSGLVYVWK